MQRETFFESCGMADLITTCFGGRNRKCAEAFAAARLPASPSVKSWDEIEAEMLGGQKLQGTLTAKEVHQVLQRVGGIEQFPLFNKIHAIAFEGHAVDSICDIPCVR